MSKPSAKKLREKHEKLLHVAAEKLREVAAEIPQDGIKAAWNVAGQAEAPRRRNYTRSETTIHGHTLSADDNSAKMHDTLCQSYITMVRVHENAFHRLTEAIRPPLTSATTESERE